MSQKNVTRIVLESNDSKKEIILIGTAHVSPKSVALVKETIESEIPDSVCIELDKNRFDTMMNPQSYKETDVVKIIKEGKVALFTVNLILSNYQKKMADQFDIKPGQEMMQAIESANTTESELVLADRDIQTTFKRIWSNCSLWEKSKLIVSIIYSIFDNEEISDEELENIKSKDVLTAALDEMGKEFKGVKSALVDERDQFLAENIKNAPGDKVVAVLGAAHVPGITKEIYKKHDLEKLSEQPKKGNFGKFFGWSIIIVLSVLIALTFSVDVQKGIEGTLYWLLLVMFGSAIGAILGGACIQAVLAAFICAPLGAISPVLASGWFSGIVEAHYRKPKVQDFENLGQDSTSLKGFFKNNVTRILIIVMTTNLGCALGNIAGSINIFANFFKAFF